MKSESEKKEDLLKKTELSIATLCKESNFIAYLKILKDFVKKYTIIIVSQITPCGKWFTQEHSRVLMELGGKIDLYGKDFHSYVAVLDSGKLIFEEISATKREIVTGSVDLNGSRIKFLSSSFQSSYVEINKKNVLCETGLNFVVYDKECKIVLDAVTFDTRTKNFICFRMSERINQFKKYNEIHPDVIVASFNYVRFPIENLTKHEKFILDKKFTWDQILKNLDDSTHVLHEFYNKEEIIELLSIPKSYHDVNGVRHFNDIQGNLVNIVGGHRVTGFQPQQVNRTIFLIGGCQVYGMGSEDNQTISSFLQEIFNQYLPEERIIIQNYGYFLGQFEDKQTDELVKILNALPVKSGDIILVGGVRMPNVLAIDVSNAALEPRTYEVFLDKGHYIAGGNRLIANRLYEKIIEYDLLSEAKKLAFVSCTEQRLSIKKEALTNDEIDELAIYKKMLKNFYDEIINETKDSNLIIGSIVMNCNPFTLGHRYLIEQALKECDYLIVFVVQENKSIFPFEDRLQLVREGVADLLNVRVIPSGRFIISSLTFSEYFNKSELQEREVDTSLDVLLFAQEIVPCLNIKKRFAGEEPFDNVTWQYNETMKKILPEYGIQFVEIPRICIGDRVISASYVRELLEKNKFEIIKEFVPNSTFCYLIKHFVSDSI